MERIVRIERQALKFRLFALLLISLGLYWAHPSWEQIWPRAILVTSYFIYILLLHVLLPSKLATPYAIYGMTLVDAATVGSAIYLAGGINSPLFIFLPLLTIYYSICYGQSASLFSGVTFSLSYAIVAITSGEVAKSGGMIVLQLPFLFLVAIISGYLSRSRLAEQRLKEELQQFIRMQSQAKGMLEAGKILSQTLDLDAVLREAVSTLPPLLQFTHCVIALRDETGKMVARAGNIDWAKLGLKSIEGLGISPTDSSSPGKELTPKIVSIPSEIPDWAEKLGAVSVVVVPLVAKEQYFGLAYLLSFQPQQPLTDNELRLAQGYGELLSTAIANAQLYQKTSTKVNQLVSELEGTIQRMERLKGADARREIVVDELHIDGAKERVLFKGKPINLSPTEFNLLYVLAENAGQPLNQETLLREVWSKDYRGQANVVDVSIHRLRKKLEATSATPRILTVRGLGYMLSGGNQPPVRT